MKQKTKVIALIAVVVVIIILGAILLKSNQPATPVSTQNTNVTPITAATPTNQPAAVTTAQIPPQVIEGQFVSANEKQIYVKLADGKGAAINISATTPVKNGTDPKIGNLSLLKKDAKLSVTVDKDTNALEITIVK